MVFEKVAEKSSVEELLVGIYSSKRKIFLLSFVGFVINTILKSSSSAGYAGLTC